VFAATRFPSGFVLEAGLDAGPAAAGPLPPCPGGGGFRVPFHYAVDWEAAEPPSRGFADLAAYFRRQTARGAPLDARSPAPRNPFRGWQRLDGAGVAGAFAEAAGVRVLGLADAGGGLACVRPAEGRVFPSGVSYLFEGALLLPVQLAGLCVRVVAGPSFYGPGDEEICAAVAGVLRQARREHPGLFAPADTGRAEVARAGRQVARSVARIRSRSVAPALWSHVYQQCGARTDEEFAEMLAAAIYHRA